VHEIDVTALHALLQQPEPPAVVDIRETVELHGGHVPGVVHVPMSELVERVHEVTALPGPVYLICESGYRSAHVAAWLDQQGHEAVNVAGGTGAWRARGYPVAFPG
jgi:rhodanese-related sulfurtransferase